MLNPSHWHDICLEIISWLVAKNYISSLGACSISQLTGKLPHSPCKLKKEGPVFIVGKKEWERKEDFQGKSPKRDLNKEA